MQLCFLLDTSAFPIESANSDRERKEAGLMDSLLNRRLENLQGEGVISTYTAIEGTYLGFPLSKPANTMIYRVDGVITDLDKAVQEYESGEAQLEAELKAVRKGWENAQPTSTEDVEKLRQVRKMFYDPASAFFGIDNIARWTAELDALDGVDANFHPKDDRGLKNELAHEAFLSIIYGSGYVMARAVVPDGKLPELEQKLDGKYVRRTIDV